MYNIYNIYIYIYSTYIHILLCILHVCIHVYRRRESFSRPWMIFEEPTRGENQKGLLCFSQICHRYPWKKQQSAANNKLWMVCKDAVELDITDITDTPKNVSKSNYEPSISCGFLDFFVELPHYYLGIRGTCPPVLFLSAVAPRMRDHQNSIANLPNRWLPTIPQKCIEIVKGSWNNFINRKKSHQLTLAAHRDYKVTCLSQGTLLGETPEVWVILGKFMLVYEPRYFQRSSYTLD